jgi:hypothetical protein
MPVNFNFTNTTTGELQTLNKVDDEICKFFGRETDPVKWSAEYEAIVYIIGMGASRMFHSASFTAEQITAAVEDWIAYDCSDLTEEEQKEWRDSIPFFIEFMVTRYQFSIWRGM